MDPHYEQHYHELEDRQWWFVARRQIVFQLVQQLGLSPHARILEIGCSTGPFLSQLREAGYRQLSGIDISAAAIAGCHARGLHDCHVMDATQLDFADQSFDLVIASDVLEHLEQDQQAAQEWLRVLVPGGRLILFVPAFQCLWSRHDEVNHHFRRYTRRHLVRVLRTAGWDVERSSYWNAALLPAVALVRWAGRLWDRLRPNKAAQDSPNSRPGTSARSVTEPTIATVSATAEPVSAQAVLRPRTNRQALEPTGNLFQPQNGVNALLIRWMGLENGCLSRGYSLPAGVSTFAIARRPVVASRAEIQATAKPVQQPTDLQTIEATSAV